MKELKLADYYSEADKERDIMAIEAFFDKKKAAEKHLDGIKMISMFVKDNRMSQWQLSKKAKSNRNNQVM